MFLIFFLTLSLLGSISNMHDLCLLQEDREFSIYVPRIMCANLTQENLERTRKRLSQHLTHKPDNSFAYGGG